MTTWLKRKRHISLGITIFIALLIFYLSSLTFPTSATSSESSLATVYHISIFFLLALFLFFSIIEKKPEWKKIIVSLFIVIVYAMLDELHQYFVPGRFSSIKDFLFDFWGIIFAFLTYLILIKRK